MATKERKRKPGRPPADVGPNGKPRKTSEYPRLLLLVRPDTRALLRKLSKANGKPVWRIVDEAVRLLECTQHAQNK